MKNTSTNFGMAVTILAQFGGTKALDLIHGTILSVTENRVDIEFSGSKQAKCMQICYDYDSDDYTVTFSSGNFLLNGESTIFEGIYCDQLQDLFADYTGINMDSVRIEFGDVYEVREGP